MALSEFEFVRARKVMDGYLDKNRPPPHIRKELDLGYELKNQSIDIFEIRPRWNDPSEILNHPVAKTTYVKTQKHWKVYWQRADLKWHGYDPCPFVKSLEEFVELVENDEYCCFFG